MTKTPKRSSRAVFQIALCLLAAVPLAGAHPVHATFAEAVWNPGTNSIEVALRVRGVDLEAALSNEGEKKVDLEKSANIDALIIAYLEANLSIGLPDGSTLAPTWSAKDIGIKNCWLYFEFPLPGKTSPAGCKLRHTVFFDDLEGQKNVVEFRQGRAKRILSFEGERREMPLAAPAPAEKAAE